jgi:hypothetical protein
MSGIGRYNHSNYMLYLPLLVISLPHFHGPMLIVIPVLALGWFLPRIGDPIINRLERSAARFAKRKTLVVLTVAMAAIFGRIALLPVFPVPVPIINDEFGYLLAGDTFAHGRLTNPPHPMWIFFDTFNEIEHPTYQSIFPPAQGAVLALGMLLGLPWIGVLLSVAAMCAAFTWMLQGWFPPRWGLLGGLLVILRLDLGGHWSSGYWGGAVAAMAAALVMGALPRIKRHLRVRDAVILGIGVAILANSRPVEGAIFCLPVAAVLGAWLISTRGPAPALALARVLLPVVCVVGLTFVFMGYYNWRVTGSVTDFPHALALRQYGGVPFFIWQTPQPFPHYTNPQIEGFFRWDVANHQHPFLNLRHRIDYDGVVWWDFFLGFALTIPLLTLPWLWSDRRIRLPFVQAAICGLSLIAVNWFYPHYAAPMAAALFLVLIQGMRHLRRWELKGRPLGIFLTRLVVFMALVHVATASWDWVHRPLMQYAFDRFRIASQLKTTPGKHLVIVHYSEDHIPQHEWVHNAADIDRSPIVWAREIPGVDLKPLLDYYADRKVWVVNADSNAPTVEPYSSRHSPGQ